MTNNKQIVNDTIKTLEITKFADTIYTISLIVNLRNLNTLQSNTRISIISDSSPLKIVSNRILYEYYNGKRVTTVNIKTNKIALCKVRYSKNGSNFDYHEKTDNGLQSYYHTIVIDDFVIPGLKYNGLAIAEAGDNKDSVTFDFIPQNDLFPTDNFIKKPYHTNLSYIYNKTHDFYKDGKQSFIVNDISGGIWNSTKVYEFNNNSLDIKDSLSDIRIPVGYGDSNGDGIPEVFTRIYNESFLYQSNGHGSSPFSKILFADSLSGHLAAAGMYDFDKDGKEDLITYTDSAFVVYSFKNGKYIQLAKAQLDTNRLKLGVLTGSVFGDFDGDGKDELCMGNSRGNIFIFKYDNGTFNLVWEDTIKYGNSSMYFTTADVNGDGIPEIVAGINGTSPIFDKEVNSDPVWNFRIYKSDTVNHYKILWHEYFYGVRDGSTTSGITYRNGVASGDLDGEKGDEVVISPFPNLYVFKYDTSSKTMVPFWWYPQSFTNSALIYNFDKNGNYNLGIKEWVVLILLFFFNGTMQKML